MWDRLTYQYKYKRFDSCRVMLKIRTILMRSSNGDEINRIKIKEEI